MQKITLGAMEVGLKRPDSYATCYDVWAAVVDNERRAVAAALGLCWATPPKRRPGGRYNFDVLAYGGAVIDDLQKRGHSMREIVGAGAVAYSLICSELPELGEVDAAEDFSEAPADSISS